MIVDIHSKDGVDDTNLDTPFKTISHAVKVASEKCPYIIVNTKDMESVDTGIIELKHVYVSFQSEKRGNVINFGSAKIKSLGSKIHISCEYVTHDDFDFSDFDPTMTMFDVFNTIIESCEASVVELYKVNFEDKNTVTTSTRHVTQTFMGKDGKEYMYHHKARSTEPCDGCAFILDEDDDRCNDAPNDCVNDSNLIYKLVE